MRRANGHPDAVNCGSGPGFVRAFVLADGTFTGPEPASASVIFDQLSGWLGSKFAVQVIGTQGDAGSENVWADISADLVLRAQS